MIPQAFNTEFSLGHVDRFFLALTSTDKELRDHFDKYLHDEYDEEFPERLSYLDMAEIARFLIDRVEAGQTNFFQDLFTQMEIILLNCDSYVNELMIIGLFESIQNNCGHKKIDYHQGFDKWLNPISKQKWDVLIDFWEGIDWREKSTGL
ncbi:hypothetical protein GCM10027422_41070 [Hymenobacter arcticus]